MYPLAHDMNIWCAIDYFHLVLIEIPNQDIGTKYTNLNKLSLSKIDGLEIKNFKLQFIEFQSTVILRI